MKVLSSLYETLALHTHDFHQVVNFDPVKEKLVHLDFTANNKELEETNVNNTEIFSRYIQTRLKKAKAKFGIGGYNELRILYAQSELFSPPSFLKDGKT